MTQDWERIRPQRVRHAGGYEVYSVGRYQIGYQDSAGKALVPVEPLSDGVGIEPGAIVRLAADGTARPVDAADRAVILKRTVDGLRAMGSDAVVGRQ